MRRWWVCAVMAGAAVVGCSDDGERDPSLPDEAVVCEGGGCGGGGVGAAGGEVVDTGVSDDGDAGMEGDGMGNPNNLTWGGLILPSGGGDRPMLAITGCLPGNTCTARVAFSNMGSQPVSASLRFEDNNAYLVDASGGCDGPLRAGEECALSVALLGMPASPSKICLGRLQVSPPINGYETLFVCAEQEFNLCRSDPCP